MNLDIGFYRAMVLRRLPVMILFFLLFSGLGLTTAIKLPDEYSTSARLLLESPQIPVSMIPTTVQTGAAEQLEIIELAGREIESFAKQQPDSPYWQLVLRSGELAYRARLTWCDEAEAVISRQAKRAKKKT